jgi:hypothetical protein
MTRNRFHPAEFAHGRVDRITTVFYVAALAALAWGVHGYAHMSAADPASGVSVQQWRPAVSKWSRSPGATAAAPTAAPVAGVGLVPTVPDASDVLPAATTVDEPEIATYGG